MRPAGEAPGPEAAEPQFDAFADQKPNGPLPAWAARGGATPSTA